MANFFNYLNSCISLAVSGLISSSVIHDIISEITRTHRQTYNINVSRRTWKFLLIDSWRHSLIFDCLISFDQWWLNLVVYYIICLQSINYLKFDFLTRHLSTYKHVTSINFVIQQTCIFFGCLFQLFFLKTFTGTKKLGK